MGLGHWFLIGATVILSVGVLGKWWHRRDLGISVYYSLLIAPGLALTFAAVVVLSGAHWYHDLFSDRAVSWNEANFFAVQTVTTVGYGGGLTALEPPGDKAGEEEKAAYRRKREEFYFYSSILMLFGMGGVAMFIGGAAGSLVDFSRKRSDKSHSGQDATTMSPGIWQNEDA